MHVSRSRPRSQPVGRRACRARANTVAGKPALCSRAPRPCPGTLPACPGRLEPMPLDRIIRVRSEQAAPASSAGAYSRGVKPLGRPGGAGPDVSNRIGPRLHHEAISRRQGPAPADKYSVIRAWPSGHDFRPAGPAFRPSGPRRRLSPPSAHSRAGIPAWTGAWTRWPGDAELSNPADLICADRGRTRPWTQLIAGRCGWMQVG